MAAYTGTLTLYQPFNEFKGDGTIDLDDATAGYFKVLLTTSSYTPAATHSTIGNITNELTAAGGYARQNLGSVTWSTTGNTATWDAANTQWTASGADFDAARYFVIFADGAANDALIGYGNIDNTPADVTVTDGTTLTLQWNNSGIFTSSIT